GEQEQQREEDNDDKDKKTRRRRRGPQAQLRTAAAPPPTHRHNRCCPATVLLCSLWIPTAKKWKAGEGGKADTVHRRRRRRKGEKWAPVGAHDPTAAGSVVPTKLTGTAGKPLRRIRDAFDGLYRTKLPGCPPPPRAHSAGKTFAAGCAEANRHAAGKG
ncbi:uncharacterized protein Tco025E_09990, partial [Trypanosoma conorhini]